MNSNSDVSNEGTGPDWEDSIIVYMNIDESIFKDVFSKMEIITALGVIKKAVEKYGLPEIYTMKEMKDDALLSYRLKKFEQKMMSRMSPSNYDEEYISDFRRYIPENYFTITDEDIFRDSRVRSEIEKYNRKNLVFCGFYTESDIYLSASESILNGYYAYVLSDGTSTISERTYFEALDLLSQSVEIIDSRDLLRNWELTG